MSQDDRLTRRELAWLLTQEARSAAETLRKGVAARSQGPEIVVTDASEGTVDVESSLDTLDDAMKMLASLHSGMGARGRRGRIDLAALLCDLVPSARVHITPGSGTEVFGEESELRRMLQVLIARTSGARTNQVCENPVIRIERVGNDVWVTVMFGPDTVAGSGPEHAWLSRMALRHGGRLELEGGRESLVLPAEGEAERREVEALRKELHEAQQQGEAYARELAAVFAAGESVASSPISSSIVPPPIGNLAPMVAVAAMMRAEIEAASAALRQVLTEIGAHGGSQIGSVPPGSNCVERLDRTARQLETLDELDAGEIPALVEVTALLAEVVEKSRARQPRRTIELATTAGGRMQIIARPTAMRVLLRSMIGHIEQNSPEDAALCVAAERSDDDVAVTVGCPSRSAPAGMQNQFEWTRVDVTEAKASGGMGLLFAATLASHLNGTLEISVARESGVQLRAVLPTA